MKRNVKNFYFLFNFLWYKDFPLTENTSKWGRTDFTAHVMRCIRSCADLMGYHTYHEKHDKIDAIIEDGKGNEITFIECESDEPSNPSVDEIRKLNKLEGDEFSTFISYSRDDHHKENIKKIRREWTNTKKQLIVFLVRYAPKYINRNYVRDFTKHCLETYVIQSNNYKKRVHSQRVLPWEVVGTKWQRPK
jgi:hypothetical protein